MLDTKNVEHCLPFCTLLWLSLIIIIIVSISKLGTTIVKQKPKRSLTLWENKDKLILASKKLPLYMGFTAFSTTLLLHNTDKQENLPNVESRCLSSWRMMLGHAKLFGVFYIVDIVAIAFYNSLT